MPTFGDYETIGEIAITEERGHVTTVWKARKSGARGARLFVIKCYAPRLQTPNLAQPQDALQRDRALEFLDGIKDLKKAHSEGARFLVPVHAFGLGPEGAWYATDFCPRKTLKEFIGAGGNPDTAMLRHIVHCVAVGCLELKRSRGPAKYSHGNLKPSNVLLAGKVRPLRKTPLLLTDPHPGPLQLTGLDLDDLRTVGNLLAQVVEAQDLRAIGELIFQLVEGRLVSSADDYNYPVVRSDRWERLGKDGEFWRELCNRLLDPKLSLDTEKLEKLEREFRPNVVVAKLPVILLALGGVCLLGGGLYFGVQRLKQWENDRRAIHEKNQRAFSDSITSGERLLRESNYAQAAIEFAGAVKLAEDLNDSSKKKTAGDGQGFASALAQAKQAAQVGDEVKSLEDASRIRKDPKVETWVADAKRRKGQSDAVRMVAQEKTELDAAIAGGERLLGETKYAQAAIEFGKAVKLAEKLNDGGKKKAASDGQGFASALAQARQAARVEDEVKSLEEALRTRKEAKVETWLADARRRKGQSEMVATMTQKKAELDAAISSGERLLGETNYAQAAIVFDKALKLAGDLNDGGKQKTASDGRAFASALAQANQAARVEDKVRLLEEALRLRKDAKVETLLADARRRKGQSELVRTLDQKKTELDTAVANGERLLGESNYAQAAIEFAGAVKLAEDLNDSGKKKTATDGQGFASALAQAKQAAQVEDEVKSLEDALRIRKDPKVETWVADAKRRKGQSDAVRMVAQQKTELDAAIAGGERLLGETNYAQAAIEFGKAVKLAEKLNDGGKKKAASDGQGFASALAQARQAARVEDEVKSLEEALRIRKEAKVETWLADALRRKGQSEMVATMAQKKAELDAAIASGERLLGETNYAQAAIEFDKALKLAGDLNDGDKRKAATDGQSFARALARAEVAGEVEVEIKLLEEALNIRSDAKVGNWLKAAKLRQELAQKRKEFDKAIAEGKQAVLRNKFAEATNEFSKALKVSAVTRDQRDQAIAINRLYFATELLQASPLPGTTNFYRLWEHGTNAVFRGEKGGVSSEEMRVANLCALLVATNACERACEGFDTNTNWFQEATNWLARAKDLRIQRSQDDINKLDQRIDKLAKLIDGKKKTPPSVPPRPNTNVFDIEFAWVAPLGTSESGGAYVEVSELSGRDYSNLCSECKITLDPKHYFKDSFINSDYPAVFDDFEVATNFLNAVNNSDGAKAKGRFRLPQMDEFIQLVEGKVKYSPDELADLSKNLEWIGKRGIAAVMPRRAREGTKNTRGLLNLGGNFMEWSADGKPFGIPYLSKLSTGADMTIEPPRLLTDTGGQYGLRLVFEPAPGKPPH